MTKETKSCTNCRWLSEAFLLPFKADILAKRGDLQESRVTCLRGQWPSSSIVTTIYANPGRYRARAEKCESYESSEEAKNKFEWFTGQRNASTHACGFKEEFAIEVARQKVSAAVKKGLLPRAQDLPCMDCGHVGGDRIHDYDHFMGYSERYQLTVQPVCHQCHMKRHSFERQFKRFDDAKDKHLKSLNIVDAFDCKRK